MQNIEKKILFIFCFCSEGPKRDYLFSNEANPRKEMVLL